MDQTFLFVFMAAVIVYFISRIAFASPQRDGGYVEDAEPLEGFRTVPGSTTSHPSAPQDWNAFAPQVSPDLAGVKLLNPIQFIVTSTSGVKKNNSLDIRQAIVIPKQSFPWNNSSLQPTDFRRNQSIDTI
jgi:hypothetical protein